MDSSKSPPSLRTSLRAALHRRKSKQSLRRLTLIPETSTDFSSNDFLSLSTSPLFRARYTSHLAQAPPFYPFASGGSRLLTGNSPYAEALESFIADFHNAPSGLLFNSGFDANVGVLSCIPQPGDIIIHDEYIHASAHEGMRLSRAGKKIPFAHSCPRSLEDVLRREVEGDEMVRNGKKNVFVVIESIYSMDGDIAPIREFVEVVERVVTAGNAYFVVDEAHATGAFGPRGAGVVQELGVEEKMFIRVHTFGKALASHGGELPSSLFSLLFHLKIHRVWLLTDLDFSAIVLCCPDTREYLINYARSLIYTTALGFPFLASIRTAYELLSEGETEEVCHFLVV